MEVIRAQAMGFCFGVRDALQLALELERPEETTLYGELVHNEQVLARLAARGFRQLGEEGRRGAVATPRVLITAHGISHRERGELLRAGAELVDTTCPLVRRAHDAALALARAGYHVVVIGRAGHVEVRGLIGDLDSCSVISRSEEVQRWPHAKLGVICQTTFPQADAEALLRAIRAANPHAEVLLRDTICEPTKQRQKALLELIAAVDVVVVVGGSRSHNTQQLQETCRRAGRAAHWIQGPAELDASWFEGCSRVGLTAGTSTPDDLIDAVAAALAALPAGGAR
jgi:4-hydroxy-3-methylbut-2-enyl diphosphate reductase